MAPKKNSLRNLMLLTQLGMSVIVPILLCVYAGLYIEKRFDFNITLLLLFLGMLAGGRNAWLLVKKASALPDHKKEEADGSEGETDDF